MERIDYVEAAALRNLRLFRTFPFRHVALICIIVFAVTSLGNPHHIAAIAWNAGRRAVSLAASLLITAMRVVCILVLAALAPSIPSYARRLRRHLTQGYAGGGHGTGGTRRQWQNIHQARRPDPVRRRGTLSFRRLGFRTEEEQLAEAMARSLAEQ